MILAFLVAIILPEFLSMLHKPKLWLGKKKKVKKKKNPQFLNF